MLKLYQFPRRWDLPNASPFCVKLEAFLRLHNIPHETVFTLDMKAAPKHKLPYIEDDHGKLGDSNLIIEYLCRKYRIDPDAALTAEQRAVSLAFRRLCEENLFWVILYARWRDPKGWKVLRDVVFAKMKAPFFVRRSIANKRQKKIIDYLHAQGMGRHSAEEIYRIGCQDVQALSDFLSDKPYFFGYTPTLLDVVAFSFLLNVMYVPIESPVKELAHNLPNLVNYMQRMREKLFPDFMEKAAA